MSDMDIQTQIKTLIELQIIQALNNAPDAVEMMVKAALSRPVSSDGKYDGYGSKIPYIDYLVGDEIRRAAGEAVRKVVSERIPDIEAHVRSGLNAESVIAAFTKSLIGATEQDWRIDVKFAPLCSRHRSPTECA